MTHKHTTLPSDVQKAFDLVRGYQLMLFVDRMKEAMPQKRSTMREANEAMKKHGATEFNYATRLDSIVLLSSLLTEAEFSARPDLEQVRLNFIVGIANTVNRLNPALASVALGETRTQYHMPVSHDKSTPKNTHATD